MEINDKQLKIRVHHIGGIGSCGPTEALGALGRDIQWTIYDAEEVSLDACASFKNRDYSLVNKCIGASDEKGKFNVTLAQSASSMLLPAKSAAQYTLPTNGKVIIWGEHTDIVKSVDIEINRLDSLVNRGDVPTIDFLSVDAQGAELDIINGASSNFKSSVLGIVCEVEFARLYEGQGLFCDTQQCLEDNGFRLCEIYNHLHFNTSPYPLELQGKGFHTVSEALFLKELSSLIGENPKSLSSQEVARCIKLAAIGVVFDQLDFSLGILRTLEENNLIFLDELAKTSQCNYIKLLRDLMALAKKIEGKSKALHYDWIDPSQKGPKPQNISQWAPSLFKRGVIFLQFGFARMMRLVAKELIKKDIGGYYSSVSKLFYRYGLYKVAEKHDTRFIKNILSPMPKILQRLFYALEK